MDLNKIKLEIKKASFNLNVNELNQIKQNINENISNNEIKIEEANQRKEKIKQVSNMLNHYVIDLCGIKTQEIRKQNIFFKIILGLTLGLLLLLKLKTLIVISTLQIGLVVLGAGLVYTVKIISDIIKLYDEKVSLLKEVKDTNQTIEFDIDEIIKNPSEIDSITKHQINLMNQDNLNIEIIEKENYKLKSLVEIIDIIVELTNQDNQNILKTKTNNLELNKRKKLVL